MPFYGAGRAGHCSAGFFFDPGVLSRPLFRREAKCCGQFADHVPPRLRPLDGHNRVKRTVVQRFDTLGGEESFLKGLLVKGFRDSFFFLFLLFFFFFRKETRGERDDRKVPIYFRKKENFRKVFFLRIGRIYLR